MLSPRVDLQIEFETPYQVEKWHDGDLTVGDPVFYRGERYWVEYVPSSFGRSAHVRISDHKIRPDQPAFDKRTSFFVPADLLMKAPTAKPGHKGPSLKDVERIEREKQGIKDVGDRVAELLRGKTLDEAYTVAARFMRVPEEELRAKYMRLNNGQQRMNLGNRMRQWEKKHV